MLHRQFTACRNGTNYHAAVAPALQRTRTVLCSAQAASAAADTAESVKQLLTRRSYAPPRFAGPIKVTEIPGEALFAFGLDSSTTSKQQGLQQAVDDFGRGS